MVIIPYQFKDKSELRKWLWKYLSDYHLTMLPRPCFAKVPSFKALNVATTRLCKEAAWVAADTVLMAPDDVTLEARREAIRQGKTLIVPIPKTATAYRLREVPKGNAVAASLMKEMGRFADVIALSEIGKIPLFVYGALSVDRYGNWLGQSDIFGELHPSLTTTDGILHGTTRIALVDDMQIFEDFAYLQHDNDAAVDLMVTKTQTVTPEVRQPDAAPDAPIQIT